MGVDLDVYQFELHHVTQTGLKRPATTYKVVLSPQATFQNSVAVNTWSKSVHDLECNLVSHNSCKEILAGQYWAMSRTSELPRQLQAHCRWE